MPQPAERVSRGHERIRAPLFTSALEPTSAACAWAREANEGRSGFVSARTHGPPRPWSPRVASKTSKSSQDKIGRKILSDYCNGRTFASTRLETCIIIFLQQPRCSTLHASACRRAFCGLLTSQISPIRASGFSIVYGTTVLVTSQVTSIRKGSHQAARRIHINTCPFACTRPRIRIRHWITRHWSTPAYQSPWRARRLWPSPQTG